MRRALQISAAVLLCLVALLAVAITLTVGWRPVLGPSARPLTNRVFERTPERLARGQYIVEHEAACVDCHSPHDWSKHNAPIPDGMEGAVHFGTARSLRVNFKEEEVLGIVTGTAKKESVSARETVGARK